MQLDRGSEWVARVMPFLLLAQGNTAEARESVKRMPTRAMDGRDFLRACLNPGQSPSFEAIAQEFEAGTQATSDPERRFSYGTLFAYCGKKDAALRLMTSAVEGNYCASTALQTDPLLVKLRGAPEFAQLLSAAKVCNRKFLAQRDLRAH